MLEEHAIPSDYIWLINYLFTGVFAAYVKETAATGVLQLNARYMVVTSILEFFGA